MGRAAGVQSEADKIAAGRWAMADSDDVAVASGHAAGAAAPAAAARRPGGAAGTDRISHMGSCMCHHSDAVSRAPPHVPPRPPPHSLRLFSSHSLPSSPPAADRAADHWQTAYMREMNSGFAYLN